MKNPALLPGALLAAFLLSACGSGENTSSPYAVARSIDLGATTAPVPTTDTAVVAQAGSLLREAVDELEDQVDELGEWLVRGSGNCVGGGSVAVEESSSAGRRLKTLRFAECIEDEEYLDGTVALDCASGGCAGNGSVRFGQSGQPFVLQDLDGGQRVSELLLGEIAFENYVARGETGRLLFDLDARFVDQNGDLGALRLDGVVFDRSDLGSGLEQLSYDGDLRFTAFRTAAGSCAAAGSLNAATLDVLVYDDGRDRTTSGRLGLGDAGAEIAWSDGRVTATGDAGATASFSEHDFDRLCEFADD